MKKSVFLGVVAGTAMLAGAASAQATLEAVKACKGRPGMVDGKPERLSGRVEYVWKLVD